MIDLSTKPMPSGTRVLDDPPVRARRRPLRTVLVATVATVVAAALAMGGSILLAAPTATPKAGSSSSPRSSTSHALATASGPAIKSTNGQPVPLPLQNAIRAHQRATGGDAAGRRAAKTALETDFTSKGVRVANSGHVLTLAALSVGRASGATALGTPRRSVSGDRTSFSYAGDPRFTSWYVEQHSALEQGFTIAQRPGGTGASVSIAVPTGGTVIPQLKGPHTVSFVAASGTALRDSGLRVTDVSGRVLPSHFEVSGRTVTIAYDDTGAVYPVTVDPWVQTASLQASGVSATSVVGTSVAVSSDGLTAIVGDPSAGVDAFGGATIYYDITGTWSVGTDLIVPSDAVSFGTTVAISANGATALVGDPNAQTGESPTTTGAAYVYTLSGATWSPPIALTIPATACALGTSVALSGDGSTALVGDPDDDCADAANQVGAAWVYTISGGTASAPVGLTQPLTASTFGTAVALTAATTTTSGTAVVGDSSGGSGSGAVTVYTLSGGVWTAGSSPATPAHSAAFGSAVSVASAGAPLVVGDPAGGTSSKGLATKFGAGPTWAAQALTPLSNQVDFGFSVSVGENGSMIAVGDEGANTVRTYASSTGFTARAVTSPAGSVAYGTSVALDAVGTLLFVGDPQGQLASATSPTGIATHAFYNGTAWGAATTLTEQNPPGAFGTSVALSSNGQTAIVGDPGAGGIGGGAFTGGATIFTEANGAWDGGSQLPVPPNSAVFGTSVALSGDGLTALVGDPQGSTGSTGQSTIFTLTDTKVWVEAASLPQPSTAGEFGVSVALDGAGDEAVVGDTFDSGTGVGEANVYNRTSIPVTGCSTTASSAVVTTTGSFTTSGVVAGTPVSGTGIPADTTVSAVTSATQLTLSQSATATGSSLTLTFLSAWSAAVQLTPPFTAFEFGASVSLSSSGATALVGDFQEGATVYQLSGGVWDGGTSLNPPAGSETFGSSVSLDAAGTEALVGDPDAKPGSSVTGDVTVYTESGGVWSGGTALTVPSGSSNFGSSVSLSPDGFSALVGDPFKTVASVTTGAAYGFTLNGGVWSAPSALPPPTDFPPQNFGSSVGIAANGLVAIVGDPAGGNLNGAASTYSLPASATQLAITTSPITAPAGTSPTNEVTVQLENASNAPIDATSTITVNLATTSAGGVFSASPGGGGATSVTIGAGASSTNFYYADTVAGSPMLTASASGLTSAVQTETIMPSSTTKLAVASSSSATVGTALSVTVTAEDQFNNTTPAYAGTVHFISSDASASLPSNYTFVPGSDHGVHTFSVTFKTAGSQTLTATDTVSGSITGTDDVTVAKSSSLTGTVGTSPSGSTNLGTSVTYSVSAVSGGGVAPSGGTVTFVATNTLNPGGITLCTTIGLSGGAASCNATNAPGGSDTITATYNGDANYSAGTTIGTVLLTVNRAITTTSPGVVPSTTFGGESVQYSATVTSGAGTPTGTVTFTVTNGTVTPTVCNNVAIASGTATCTSSVAPVGTDTVTASYSGDNSFAPSSNTTTLTVNPPLSISTTSLPDGTFGQSYSQSVIATGGQTPYHGWTVHTGSLPTGLGINASTGAITGTATVGGTFSFTVQVTDSETSPVMATSGTLSIMIDKVTPTVTPGVVPSSTFGGESVQYSAGVTSGAGTPTGTVTFTVTNGTVTPTVCSNVAIVSGTATCTSSAAPVGTDTVTATYNGDNNFSVTSNATTLTVNPPLTVSTTSLPGGTLGVSYNQSVTATGGQTPYHGWAVASGALPTSLGINASTGAITGTPTAVGTFTFTAQVTDSETSPVTATSGTLSITIAKVMPAVSPGVVPSTTYGGESVQYSAGVTSGAGTPTGTVTFTVTNGTVTPTVCNNVAIVSGTATCTSSAAPLGTDTVTATYSGDSNFVSTSNTTTLTVNPPLSVSTTSLPGGTVGVAYDQSVTATGGQSPYQGWALASGALPPGTGIDASTGAITGAPTTTGVFTFTVQVMDSETSPATATSGTLSITIAPGTATVTSVAALPAGPVIFGTSVQYSATVTGDGLTPTGSLTFKIGATTLCTASPLVSGSASCNATNAPVGTDTVTATYNGDSNYNSGATGTTSLTVDPTALVITTSSLPGGTQGTSYNATVHGSGGVTPYHWAVTSGALPPGLGLNSSTGAISGTPSSSGTFDFTVRLSDSHSDPTTTKALSITVAAQTLHGYWLVAGDGGIFTFGHAKFFGSTGSFPLQRPVTGMTPTGDRQGYWMVATDGGMFAFGDAKYFGSIPGDGIHPAGSGASPELAKPIVAMVASPDGHGYLLVASDGGVFAFGDARFHGSCPGIGGCSGAVVEVVPDTGELGYWVVTATGHVYAFGNAASLGEATQTPTPITGAVASASGHGYLVVNSQGDVYAFGDAHSLGAAPGGLPAPIEGIVADSTGQGYWLMGSTGAVYQYGDAPNYGSMFGKHLNAPIVTAAGF